MKTGQIMEENEYRQLPWPSRQNTRFTPRGPEFDPRLCHGSLLWQGSEEKFDGEVDWN